LGNVGGEEAKAYLEMVSLGHEIPEVRLIAKQMLNKLTIIEVGF
jgi:hypothetical protein